MEHGYARRMRQSDAVHGGGMRAYARTHSVAGAYIGDPSRLTCDVGADDPLESAAQT